MWELRKQMNQQKKGNRSSRQNKNIFNLGKSQSNKGILIYILHIYFLHFISIVLLEISFKNLQKYDTYINVLNPQLTKGDAGSSPATFKFFV